MNKVLTHEESGPPSCKGMGSLLKDIIFPSTHAASQFRQLCRSYISEVAQVKLNPGGGFSCSPTFVYRTAYAAKQRSCVAVGRLVGRLHVASGLHNWKRPRHGVTARPGSHEI